MSTRKKEDKMSSRDLTAIVEMMEHPGFNVLDRHLEILLDRANRLTLISAKGTDVEIAFNVKVAQAQISIYNGLRGFFNEARIKLKNSKEDNDG